MAIVKFGLLRGTVGHAGLNIMLYLHKSSSEQKYLVLFYSKKYCDNEPSLLTAFDEYKKTNKNMFLFESRIFSGIISRIIHYKILKSIFNYLIADTYNIHHSKKYLSFCSQYRVWYNNVRQPHCEVRLNYKKQFKKFCDLIGLNKKYVCVFSRDDGYYPEFSSSDFRNSSFESLVPTINFLLKNDFQVVRVGRKHLKDKILNNKKNFFDLDEIKTEIESEIIDLMIFKECEFVLGGNSGINMIAFLFNKPVLLHNYFPIGLIPIYQRGSYICKKYLKNGKIVPYFNLPQEILLTEKRTTLEKRGYLVLDNTPKEILEFTRGQIKSSFSDVIKPNTKEFVYGGPSGIDKKWFKKNKDLFSSE